MPRGIYKRTEKQILQLKKMAEAQKGKKRPPFSEGWKRNMSKAFKGRRVKEETKKKLSLANKGKKLTEEQKMKMPRRSEEWRRKKSAQEKGRKRPPRSKEYSRNISKSKMGSKNPAWKGGITRASRLIRNSPKYKQWRMDCFIRDNFTCRICKDNSGENLEIHHKKFLHKLLTEAKSYLPLFDHFRAAMLYTPLWNLDNGVTLCKRCHNKKGLGRPKQNRARGMILLSDQKEKVDEGLRREYGFAD